VVFVVAAFVVGGVLVVVVVAAVTVKVCGVYCVTSDGNPSVTQEAAIVTGAAGAFAGMANLVDHDPPACVGACTSTLTDVAETET
jgi:hypothetical protein